MNEKTLVLKNLFEEIENEIEGPIIELKLPFEISKPLLLKITEILLFILELGKYDFKENNWWKNNA